VPVNVPVLLVVRPTVPVGVMKVPSEVSDTVTLQVDATPIVSGEPQLTLVEVVLTVTVILVVPLLAW
jgi:hypothetical protein